MKIPGQPKLSPNFDFSIFNIDFLLRLFAEKSTAQTKFRASPKGRMTAADSVPSKLVRRHSRSTPCLSLLRSAENVSVESKHLKLMAESTASHTSPAHQISKPTRRNLDQRNKESCLYMISVHPRYLEPG